MSKILLVPFTPALIAVFRHCAAADVHFARSMKRRRGADDVRS